MLSDPIPALLATAIPLPSSPEPPSQTNSNHVLYGSHSDLKRSISLRGSILSLNQRMHNMHQGMPAHHDPSSNDDVRGSTGSLKRSTEFSVTRRSNESIKSPEKATIDRSKTTKRAVTKSTTRRSLQNLADIAPAGPKLSVSKK